MNKELWGPLIQPDSDLASTGVVINVVPPKRKDGLFGVGISVPNEKMVHNQVVTEVAEKLAPLVRPDGYIFQVVVYDNDLGTHITSNEATNPLEAFEKAKIKIKRLLVDSEAQNEAIRIEEEESRFLDMAENAAIAERVNNSFKFQIDKVDVNCYPASWSFGEREEN